MYLRAALRLAHRQGAFRICRTCRQPGRAGCGRGSWTWSSSTKSTRQCFSPTRTWRSSPISPGWRYEEVCGLELAWVFQADAEIRLPDSKNGQGRVIVLQGRLWELVEKWWAGRRLDCARLFQKNGRRVKDALREHWRTACATAGIPEVKRRGPTGWRSFAGVSIHDLRRSAIRNMRRAGVAESVAMTISGH